MTYIRPEDWQPSPGIRLEGTALDIVRSNTSMSVLAGPGAGKTEILAQKATYLLTTGLCPPPNRILAIAFKVDAARNLQTRVSDRCEPVLAQRFESLTLDAFAKKLVDQFLEAIPDQWRPSSDYRIIFPNPDIWQDFGNRNADECPSIRGKNNSQLNRIVHRSMPPLRWEDVTTEDQSIQWRWWRDQIHATRSCLTFDMIKLMASSILSNQHSLRSALRNTYAYVFLDEFQDVTSLQYELIRTAFHGSSSILTAVGDSNQAIMRWAGAREDIFDQFIEDFEAVDERLLFNFRSNERIVELINDLAATFDDEHVQTECARQGDPVPENSVEGWVFDTRQAEAEKLASYIADQLEHNPEISPCDFVILARLRVNDVEDRLLEEFRSRGLRIRNEARNVGGIAIQDLVKEKAYSFLLACLKLATNVREGQPFQDCRNTIADVRGTDLNSDKGHSESIDAVRNLIGDLEEFFDGRMPTAVTGREITDLVFNHVERGELQRTYREYTGGERLNSTISGFEAFFDECRGNAASWLECISTMEGSDSVRLMTIHKSKGLEYHTVIFVEFNDDAFWGNADDVNVFFVALSRARERVFFSFTKDSKGIENIQDLHQNLEAAGVTFVAK